MSTVDAGQPGSRPWAALIIDLALGALAAVYSLWSLDNLAAGELDAWLVLLAAVLFVAAGIGLIARAGWAARLGQVAAAIVLMIGAVMLLQGVLCAGGFCGLFAGAAFILGVVFIGAGLAVWFANHNA